MARGLDVCGLMVSVTNSICALSEQTKPVRLHRLWTDYASLIYVLEKVFDAED